MFEHAPNQDEGKRLLLQLKKEYEERLHKQEAEDDQQLKRFEALTEKIEKLLQKAILHSIEEEKKAQLRTKILYLLYKKVEPHICLIEGRAKIFPNETCNSIEKSIKYAFYVIEAITLGRPIEDIFKVLH